MRRRIPLPLLVASLWFLGFAIASAQQTANNVLNLSARNFISSTAAGSPLIGGFITQGSQPMSVVLRGIGPSLRSSGVNNAMQDPVIELHDSNGTLLQKNDDWVNSADAQRISALGLAPKINVEAAILANLTPGSYTVLLYGYDNGKFSGGVGVVEMYDLQSSSSRFGNISTLGGVTNTDNTLFGGFIIGGNQAKQIVVRAVRQPSDTTSDPRVDVYDGSGALVASNDDWQQDPQASDVQRVGLAPKSPKEAALFRSLDPGSYTAVAHITGAVFALDLIEIYDVTTPPP